jgi:hypothetical protein
VLVAVLLAGATRSGASTVVEPIARLTLDGGYDSNPLYDGSGSDRMGRISPDLGLRMRDHLWDARAVYGGDWVYYDRLAPKGFWNHRGVLSLASHPTRRLHIDGDARANYTSEPAGLAFFGVFRTGRQSATLVGAHLRTEYRAAERWDVAGVFSERSIVFGDRTGGLMHAPSVEALYRVTPRLSAGGAYAFAMFQDLDPKAANKEAFSNALRGRLRYRLTRALTLEAFSGPAFWQARSDRALVPEASVELYGTTRNLDYRVSLLHGLGIGTTAHPGLLNTLEFGVSRRFLHRFEFRADGGIWNSGNPPSGGIAPRLQGTGAVTGYAAGGELALLVGGGVRIGLAAAHFGRLDDASTALQRTTAGLRIGWELPHR